MKIILNNNSIYFTLIFLLIITNSCQKRTEVVLRENEEIVFLSNREAPRRQFDVFSMNLDGSGQFSLTKDLDGIRSISNPQVSPDGKEIVFIVFEGGRRLLQKMNIDGSYLKILTEIQTDVPDPRFSPDASRIVYVDKIQQRRQIIIMDRDGANRKNISNKGENLINLTNHPKWDSAAAL